MKKNKRLSEIGCKIVYYRRLRNVKQIDLAVAAGISQSYLSKIENGKYETGGSITIFLKIARALNVDLKKILQDENF